MVLRSTSTSAGVLIVDYRLVDLHALGHREGMGKSAFPPQGVGAPILLGTGFTFALTNLPKEKSGKLQRLRRS